MKEPHKIQNEGLENDKVTLEHLIESISDGTQQLQKSEMHLQENQKPLDIKSKSQVHTQMNNSGPLMFNSVDS